MSDCNKTENNSETKEAEASIWNFGFFVKLGALHC